MACAVLLAELPQHYQSMQRIAGASSQRLLALGNLPRAPYLHCTDRSGRCRSHQIGNTCSLRPCVLVPANRNNGHPFWDRTWPRQSACPRRLDLKRSRPHGTSQHICLELTRCCSLKRCLQALLRHGTPPRKTATHRRCTQRGQHTPDRSLPQQHSSPHCTHGKQRNPSQMHPE